MSPWTVWCHFYSYDVINSRQIASYDSTCIALNKLQYNNQYMYCFQCNSDVCVKLLQLHQCCTQRTPCTDPVCVCVWGGGEQGVRTPPPLKNQKDIGFLSNTGPDPLKNHKDTNPAFNVGAIIGTPAKRHLNGVSLAGPWWPNFSGIWILSLTKKKVGTPLKKLSGSAHEHSLQLKSQCKSVVCVTLKELALVRYNEMTNYYWRNINNSFRTFSQIMYLCFIESKLQKSTFLKNFSYYSVALNPPNVSDYPHAFLKKRRGYCNRLRPSVCPLCYLLLNHWTKYNQIWCVSYWHEWGVQRQTFFCPPPGALGRGQKVKYHLISITKSISKNFIPNFVCVLTNERYKTYQTRFSFCPLGQAPGVGLWGAGGAEGVKKKFFQTWSCGISNWRGWRAE